MLVVAFPEGVLEEDGSDVAVSYGERYEGVGDRLRPRRLHVALQLDREGWDVTVVDEKEEALGRLGDHWAGGFVVGHGMDIDVLRRAGIEEADAVVVATDGDNTNIVIGQVAQKRFDIQCVVVRVLDPARAEFYASAGCAPSARRRSRSTCCSKPSAPARSGPPQPAAT